MGKVISIINMKGGVGKTTLSIGIADYLAEIGKKVLLIDADPQFNATQAMIDCYKNEDCESEENFYNTEVLPQEKTIYRLFRPQVDMMHSYNTPTASELIINLKDNLDILCGDLNLVLVNKVSDHTFVRRIRNFIDDNSLREEYEYIIIDCPPSLNMLTVNAMTTADTVLVPIQCEYYALEGLSQLIHTINLVQERLNPELQIEGVVFTMYDVRTNLSNQVVETVKENLDTKIYNTMIPRNIRLAEAPSYGIPINMYDSKSAGAESYRNLAKEIIARKDI